MAAFRIATAVCWVPARHFYQTTAVELQRTPPPAYSSHRILITLVEGKPHSGALSNYCKREHFCAFNHVLRSQRFRNEV